MIDVASCASVLLFWSWFGSMSNGEWGQCSKTGLILEIEKEYAGQRSMRSAYDLAMTLYGLGCFHRCCI